MDKVRNRLFHHIVQPVAVLFFFFLFLFLLFFFPVLFIRILFRNETGFYRQFVRFDGRIADGSDILIIDNIDRDRDANADLAFACAAVGCHFGLV